MAERPHFLLEEGIDPDITGLFLRVTEEMQNKLIAATESIIDYLPSESSEEGIVDENGLLVRYASDFQLDLDLVRILGDDDKNDWSVSGFLWGLRRMPRECAQAVLADLEGIRTGEIVPTSNDIKMLSNLSSGDLYNYLSVLGIEIDDIGSPVLDVGTGESAGFAKWLKLERPETTVVSTSMHLVPAKSRMRRNLVGQNNVGYLVGSDGTHLPFADESFKTVVSVNADPYYTPIDELEMSLREKERVLQVGGIALLCPAVCDFGKHDIEQADIDGLDMDISFAEIPYEAARRVYRDGISQMLVIRK